MGRLAHVDHADDVVHIAVFPAAVVDGVLLHRDLGTVEDGGLRRNSSQLGKVTASGTERTSFMSFQMKRLGVEPCEGYIRQRLAAMLRRSEERGARRQGDAQLTLYLS